MSANHGAREKAMRLAEAAAEKRAIDVRVLDVSDVCSFTDYFVISSATSARHARTVRDAAVEAALELGDAPLSVEGSARWTLADFGDVVFHVFSEEAREFYALERLWGEAEPVEVPAAVVGGNAN